MNKKIISLNPEKQSTLRDKDTKQETFNFPPRQDGLRFYGNLLSLDYPYIIPQKRSFVKGFFEIFSIFAKIFFDFKR